MLNNGLIPLAILLAAHLHDVAQPVPWLRPAPRAAAAQRGVQEAAAGRQEGQCPAPAHAPQQPIVALEPNGLAAASPRALFGMPKASAVGADHAPARRGAAALSRPIDWPTPGEL